MTSLEDIKNEAFDFKTIPVEEVFTQLKCSRDGLTSADDDHLQERFGVHPIKEHPDKLNTALYLQVSIISQAVIFVTRSRSWSFAERPGLLLVAAFLAAQLFATVIYATWGFARRNFCVRVARHLIHPHASNRTSRGGQPGSTQTLRNGDLTRLWNDETAYIAR